MKNVKVKKASINKNEEKDIFDNPSPFNNGHIWPLSKGGSKITENKMKLSEKTNSFKKDKTKGIINGIRFAIKRFETKKNKNGYQEIYGKLYIKKNDEWYEIKNVR